MLRSLVLLLLGVSAAALAGCHNHVTVQSASSADGGDGWKRISCARLDKKCFSVAKAICPEGYTFAKVAGRKPIPPMDEPLHAEPPSPVESRVLTLPPQERWSSAMYSRKPGTLLVRCGAPGAPTKA